MNENAREISLKRAAVLKSRIQDYLDVKDKIPSGLSAQKLVEERKARIMEELGATEEQWNDWHWQVRSRITESETLGRIIQLTEKQKQEIDRVGRKFRWAISPNFLARPERILSERMSCLTHAFANPVRTSRSISAHGRRMTHAPDVKWTVWINSFMSIYSTPCMRPQMMSTRAVSSVRSRWLMSPFPFR